MANSKSKIWGFLGSGNMAQAIIQGAIKQNLLEPSRILISNRSLEKSKAVSQALGVTPMMKNQDLISRADIVVVGTKPQDILPVLEELKNHLRENQCVISLAAGVPSRLLKEFAGRARTVVRVMGNTPVTVQKGVFAITFVQSADEDRRSLQSFFESLGKTVVVENDKGIDAVTSGAASGAGFVLQFMIEFEAWFKKKGFSGVDARDLAVETFLGAAELAHARRDSDLSDLLASITSKKGTTLAGLQAMNSAKVPAGLRSTLDAAYQRALEISKSLLKNQKRR